MFLIFVPGEIDRPLLGAAVSVVPRDFSLCGARTVVAWRGAASAGGGSISLGIEKCSEFGAAGESQFDVFTCRAPGESTVGKGLTKDVIVG